MNLLLTPLLLLIGASVVTAGCPASGVWSEWATDPCPTFFGASSNVTRYRVCTKRCGDCPCIGPDTDIGPCGIETCESGDCKNTCTEPYTKSFNYDQGKFFCGTDNIPAVVCGSCPEKGVWSEWVTGPCPTSCGARSNVTRTRTCTKRCGDCPCSGPDSDIGPCGIAACPFPSPTGTCGAPYQKVLNDDAGIIFCGINNIPALTAQTAKTLLPSLTIVVSAPN